MAATNYPAEKYIGILKVGSSISKQPAIKIIPTITITNTTSTITKYLSRSTVIGSKYLH